MDPEQVIRAARHFIRAEKDPEPRPIGQGLIHQTYRLQGPEGSIVLQALNQQVFPDPAAIVANYLEVYRYLQGRGAEKNIPEPIYTLTGEPWWINEAGTFWRATRYIPDSYSPLLAETTADAARVARVFAGFTRSLAAMNIQLLREIISSFHHLDFRFWQFEEAIGRAAEERLAKATHLVSAFRSRKWLLDYYLSIRSNPAYPLRVMHHDCKISNILFSTASGEVICPVDLDTLMPGRFFSDLGDMIRSMACTVDENSREWEKIGIREDFYRAIVEAYLDAAGDMLTADEKKDIHYAGLIMILMQGLRFLTDFLENDWYYRISSPDQNLDRALNQLILLEKLEAFLAAAFDFPLNPSKNN